MANFHYRVFGLDGLGTFGTLRACKLTLGAYASQHPCNISTNLRIYRGITLVYLVTMRAGECVYYKYNR